MFKKQKIKVLAVMMMATAIVWADVEINVVNFPDRDFRTWIEAQNYGVNAHSRVLTKAELGAIREINMGRFSRGVGNLAGIEFFTSLEVLILDTNRLTSIDLSKNTALRTLSIANGDLASLDLSNNQNLRVVNVPNNRLAVIDLSNNPLVEELNWRNNPITRIFIHPKNPNFTLQNNLLWNKNGVLLAYFGGNNETSITIPDGVRRIDRGLFSAAQLANVNTITIGANVALGDDALGRFSDYHAMATVRSSDGTSQTSMHKFSGGYSTNRRVAGTYVFDSANSRWIMRGSVVIQGKTANWTFPNQPTEIDMSVFAKIREETGIVIEPKRNVMAMTAHLRFYHNGELLFYFIGSLNRRKNTFEIAGLYVHNMNTNLLCPLISNGTVKLDGLSGLITCR